MQLRQVWSTISQFQMLERGDKVLLGVSGGPDSVALLHLLHSKAKLYGITLYVVYVHHMLRPEADEEALYVEQLAASYGIAFRLYRVDVVTYAATHGVSLEQAGHLVRFQCFHDAKVHWGIQKLALGHHKQDRAESALIHLIQGSGLDGMTAMPPLDVWEREDDSRLIRPLAYVCKEELVQYCKEHHLRYYIDTTNLEPIYLRNRIRLELLPQLQQYNPQIVDALVRMQDTCSVDLDYLDMQVRQLWEQHGAETNESVQFPVAVFRLQHVALQRRLLRLLYQRQVGSMVNLTFVQVEQMRKIAVHTEGSQRVVLADNVVFMRQYDMLFMVQSQAAFYQNAVEQSKYATWDIATQPTLQIWNGVFSVYFDDMVTINACISDKDCNVIFADADQLSTLQIRSRQPGDQISLPGKQGHKSVKKLFIDKKVPQPRRAQIPLVFSGTEIVWIPGYFMADCIKITKQTERICKLCFSP